MLSILTPAPPPTPHPNEWTNRRQWCLLKIEFVAEKIKYKVKKKKNLSQNRKNNTEIEAARKKKDPEARSRRPERLIGIPDGMDETDGRELITHIIENFACLTKTWSADKSAHGLPNVINEKRHTLQHILVKL